MIRTLRELSTRLGRKVNGAWTSKHPCPTCLSPTSGPGLCCGCTADLDVNTTACVQCALPMDTATCQAGAQRCGRCLANPPAFDRVRTPWLYAFPVNRLIGRFKYRGERVYGRPLAEMLAEQLANTGTCYPDCLLPVPMHAERQRQRGFNQAEEIALWLSDRLTIPVRRNSLTRTRQANPQSALSRRQRQRNLRGAFRVQGSLPAHVAVVDDVVTTGATIEEIARILKRAGVETVEVWALARTPVTPLATR